MSTRNVLLALALVLIANMTTPTSSHASSTTVTTTSFLFAPASVTDLVVTYSSAAGSFTDLTLFASIPPGPTISGNGGTETVDVHYASPANATSGTAQVFTFTVPLAIADAENQVKIQDIYYVEVGGAHVAPMIDSLTFGSVPEPSSLALFGVGIAMLIACRKRISALRVC
jgi:hypothetical protein